MSELIKNQGTPKNIRGVEIDDRQKQKYSNKKEKVLGLEIEVELPEYDPEGQLIVPEAESDDEFASHLDGVFMAHLIDEEYLDEQMALQEEEEAKLKPALEGEDLKDDIKKHLGNVDMDSYHSRNSSQRSQSDAENSRRNSLQSLDNLANQLDMCDDNLREPKSAAQIYDYPGEEENQIDEFDIQRDRAFSKVSMNDDNFYGKPSSEV